MREARRLRGDGLDENGMRVAERVDGDAREEVEVALVVGVPEVRALTAHEHRHAVAEAAHQVPSGILLPRGLSLFGHHATTSVPIPF